MPRLFIVRYKRDATKAKEIKPKSLFDTSSEDLDLAAQLVALYNGSSEISEVSLFLFPYNSLTSLITDIR